MLKIKLALSTPILATLLFANSHLATADIIAPTEDVMTSSFFFPPNTVRGYVGENNRPTFRVSTDGAFGLAGAETIYVQFSPANFSAYTQPVFSASLTLTSVDGGQGANAGPDNPFVVSAHGVASDPFTSILDDTNPGGTISWLNFYNTQILDAEPSAFTTIDGFGEFKFDVTSLVNSWIAGSNPNYVIALTGKNDFSGNDFLHGFRNNSNTLHNEGFTFLTITPVPEPGSLSLLACSAVVVGWRRRSIGR